MRVKLTVSVMKGDFPGIPNPHLWVEIGGQTLAQREVTAPLDAPLELVFEAQADDLVVESKGIEITLHNKVEMPYAVEGFENDDRSRQDKPLPGGTGLFRPKFDNKAKSTPEQRPFPYIVLQRIELDAHHTPRGRQRNGSATRAKSPTTPRAHNGCSPCGRSARGGVRRRTPNCSRSSNSSRKSARKAHRSTTGCVRRFNPCC